MHVIQLTAGGSLAVIFVGVLRRHAELPLDLRFARRAGLNSRMTIRIEETVDDTRMLDNGRRVNLTNVVHD